MLKVDNLHTNYYKDWTKTDIHQFWTELAVNDHVCYIYENDEIFLNLLEGFVSDGFNVGDCVLLIATKGHRNALDACLRVKGFELEALIAMGLYIPLDAEEILSRFMVEDWPNEELFMETIAELLALAYKTHRPLRVFGEMVALLWAQGHGGATVQLEYYWKQVREREEFCLFCAYPKAGFTDDSNASLMNICSCHSKLIADNAKSSTDLFYKNTNVKRVSY